MSLCPQAYRAAYELLIDETIRRETLKHDALPEPQPCDHKPAVDLEDEIPF